MNNISKINITTIIIAYRLSTIKNFDVIYALKNREIYEQRGIKYYLNKKSTIKRVNTDEEVTFENRIFEIAKSPEDIKMNYCNIVREYWNYKFDFIITIITCVGLEGIVMG